MSYMCSVRIAPGTRTNRNLGGRHADLSFPIRQHFLEGHLGPTSGPIIQTEPNVPEADFVPSVRVGRGRGKPRGQAVHGSGSVGPEDRYLPQRG
jgi:hypothetical protein